MKGGRGGRENRPKYIHSSLAGFQVLGVSHCAISLIAFVCGIGMEQEGMFPEAGMELDHDQGVKSTTLIPLILWPASRRLIDGGIDRHSVSDLRAAQPPGPSRHQGHVTARRWLQPAVVPFGTTST
jgi:hypothetical protein